MVSFFCIENGNGSERAREDGFEREVVMAWD